MTEDRDSKEMASSDHGLEFEVPIKFSDNVQAALNTICDPDDPFNRQDFSVVGHINQLFSTEPSLTYVEEVIQNLESELDNIDGEISNILARQKSSSVDGQATLQEVKLVMGDLFDKIKNIKRKTDISETLVSEITRDMKQLDLAKKNLTTSITTLNHLHMLVSGVETLESYVKTKNFADIANLLPGIQNVLEHFNNYTTVEQIKRLSDQMSNITVEVSHLVSAEFKMYFSPGIVARPQQAPIVGQPVQIVDVCKVISVLDESVRLGLIDWYLDSLLAEYSILFEDTQDEAWLDKIEHRYTWFKDRLIDFENKHLSTFPPDWSMAKRLALKFVRLTGNMLHAVMAKRVAEIDSKVLVYAIQKTLGFEALMCKRFPVRRPVGGGEEALKNDFQRVLSGRFEKYIYIYMNSMDANLNALIDELRAKVHQYGMPSMDHGSAAVTIPISGDLFVFYKKCIQQVLQLGMSEQVLADLACLFKKYLREFAHRCLASFLPKITSGQVTTTAGLIQSFLREGEAPPRLSDTEIYNTCCILITAEFCAETISSLQEKFKEKAPSMVKQEAFDFTAEQEVFYNLISSSIQLLVQDLEGACDPALQTMAKMQWATLDQVGDESRYVGNVRQHLRSNVIKIRDHLSNVRKYFVQFCLRFVSSFIPKFIGCLFKCKSIGVTGAEQLLLDTHSLKTELVNLPVIDSVAGRKPPESFTKVVLKGMTKAERILKVVMTPVESVEAYVEQYVELLPDSDVSDFQKILDMKAIRRSEQSCLLQSYQKMTSSAVSSSKDDVKAEPLVSRSADSRVKKLEELVRKRL